jgi:ribosomal protein S17E
MGRIRGKTIRQSTLDVLRLYKGNFNDNYEANKEALNKLIIGGKTTRNKIAGYITKLTKEKKVEEFIIEHSTQ